MVGAPLENFAQDDTWGDQPFGAPMPRSLRLVDAERIAAHRLEGAAEGSLKEALATVIVPPEPEGDSLVERLQQFASELPETAVPSIFDPSSETQPPAVAALVEPDFAWFGAAPPAHAVPCFEEREFADTPTVDVTPVVVLPEEPAPQPVAETQPTAVEVTPDLAPHDEIAPAVQEPAPLLEDPVAEAVAQPAEAVTDEHPPLMELPEDPNLEPIVTAYAASARLAADAAAASQALFELQKLLNDQRLEASPELNTAMEAHGLAGLDAIPVAQQPILEPVFDGDTSRAPDPVTDASLAPPRVIQKPPSASTPVAPRHANLPPPLPLRQAAPVARIDAVRQDTPKRRPEMEQPPLRTSARPTPPADAPRRLSQSNAAPKLPVRSERTGRALVPRSQPPRRTRKVSALDLQGFAAGFVLSGAIGVVLYFVMATGG